MATKTNSPKAAASTPTPAPQSTTTGWLTVANLEQLLNEDVLPMLADLRVDMQAEALTHAERLRLLGSGVRRYGFIDKVSDIATVNPEFAPAFFDDAELKELLRKIELLRNISASFQQLVRMTDDVLLQVSDSAFQMALAYYNTVREASRRRVPGAQAIFRILQAFFRRGRRTDEEPTEPEVERDVRALLHGKKDGEIIIRNERPHLVGGKHEVVDEVHSGKVAVKEAVTAEEKE
jgi:hypothetical protein